MPEPHAHVTATCGILSRCRAPGAHRAEPPIAIALHLTPDDSRFAAELLGSSTVGRLAASARPEFRAQSQLLDLVGKGFTL